MISYSSSGRLSIKIYVLRATGKADDGFSGQFSVHLGARVAASGISIMVFSS